MANNKIIVEERSRDIGKFLVGRLLPFRKKRQVGPFTFIDHIGPSKLSEGRYMDVDYHPHIGLSTLTYLFEGEIEHRDSTGTTQRITAGDVGFMTAGKGVAHTERTPQALRDGRSFTMHGYQVWVALPKAKEEMEPRFDFVPKVALPRWQENDIAMTLVAGKGFGKESPLLVYSPLFMLEMQSKQAKELNIHGQLQGEIAVVVVKGTVKVGDEKVESGQMLISKTESECCLSLGEDTQLLLFGGKPLPEERFLYWNFVSSSKERLEQAKDDWRNKRFPKIEGEATYIPLPGEKA